MMLRILPKAHRRLADRTVGLRISASRLAAYTLFTTLLCTSLSAQEIPIWARTLSQMTWVEVRSAIDAGATSVIVPTGGIEQNGPHMAMGKHDLIVSYAAHEIARRLGETMVAPTVSFVPQGRFAPPTDNLLFPGTIGISEGAFEHLLDGIVRSLRNAGFRTIFFIGDHGMSQSAQERTAKRLSAEWRGAGVRVIQIGSYYHSADRLEMLKRRGETDTTIGFHAGLMDTAELMAVAPESVWLDRIRQIGKPLSELGASGAPDRADKDLGHTLIEMRIDAATQQIRAVLSSR